MVLVTIAVTQSVVHGAPEVHTRRQRAGDKRWRDEVRCMRVACVGQYYAGASCTRAGSSTTGDEVRGGGPAVSSMKVKNIK
jgi:hypothetical protein